MGERVFQVEAYHKQRLKDRGDTGWVEEMFSWGFVVAVVPLLSRVWFFVTTWAVACQAPFIYGISQASIVDWGAISKPRESSQPRLQTYVPALAGSFLFFFLTTEPPVKPLPEDQFSSVTQSCLTLCDPMDCSTSGFPDHHQLLEPAQTRVRNAIQPSYPLSSTSPPAFHPSQNPGLLQRVRSSHLASASIPSNEYSGLISFKIDWLDLLAVQGTLKSLLQHHSSKASILRHSAFLIIQLSHPYVTTGKSIALTRRT